MSVRVAVIGAGIMGADHARIIAGEIPGAELRIVCDISLQRAREIGDECGVADIATDPRAVIARQDVDAILIASPDETHAQLTLDAIEVGKPVLCEKPLAPTIDECLRVIDAEVSSQRKWVTLGFMRRFDPAYREMKLALTSGTLGAAIMMHNFHRNVEAPPHFTGPMAITNSAPHEFDIARFVLDTDFQDISAFQPAVIDVSRAGAPVFMVLQTLAGQLVNIEVNNNAAYGYDVRGELVGERGSVLLNTAVHSQLNLALKSSTAYTADWRPRFADAYRLQDQAWIRSIELGRPDPVAADAWDGYSATLAADAGVQALAAGETIRIEPVPITDLYAE